MKVRRATSSSFSKREALEADFAVVRSDPFLPNELHGALYKRPGGAGQ